MLKTKREVWGRCHWTGAGIDKLAKKFGESSTSAPQPEQVQEEVTLELPEAISPETHSLVYLSADADEELETLKENEIYIIGGIVDKNRHKVYLVLSHTRPTAHRVVPMSEQSRHPWHSNRTVAHWNIPSQHANEEGLDR
jgi:hypothetical protein